ncbi:MAG: 2-phospho-L-lactate transferase [Methanosarcinales archaeon]
MIILSGGTGTPKLLNGLKRIIQEDAITVIVNTAEDFWLSGNFVCPDIDTVLYTFADLIDKSKWWGIKNDTFKTYEFLKNLGYTEKLQIGDLDRAIHILRSELIRNGFTLTQATSEIAKKFKIKAKILPMSNNEISTIIKTLNREMHFQDFWIAHKGEPEVIGVEFKGIMEPSSEVISALESEKDVIIGPSNPITSIGPIIALNGIKKLLKQKNVIAISPIIGHQPVSGPAGKLMHACGYEVSSSGVIECYKEFLDTFIIDVRDDLLLGPIYEKNINILSADTRMTSVEKSISLAKLVVDTLSR